MTSKTVKAHMTAAQLLGVAIDKFKKRDFDSALSLAEQLLAAFPGNLQVLSLTAASARELGLHAKQEACLRALIEAHPNAAEGHNDLGILLKTLGRNEEAGQSFQAALTLKPQMAAAHANLGSLMHTMGRFVEAEVAYRQALAVEPNHVDALYNLGLLKYEQNQEAAAEACFRHAIEANSSIAEIFDSLGQLLAKQRRDAEAEAAFQTAIRLQPNFANAHYNLAVALMASHRFSEATDALRHALTTDPNHALAMNCFGNIMMTTNHPDKAEMAFRRAVELRPELAEIHVSLGNLVMSQGKLAEAEALFRHAFMLGKVDGYSLGQAISCARQSFSWARFSEDALAIKAALERDVEGIPALVTLSMPNLAPNALKNAAALACPSKLRPFFDMPPLVASTQHPIRKRLRVGYISPDFRNHAVMHLLAGVFEAHDRNRLHIHAYSLVANRDGYRDRIEAACETFRDLSQLSALAAARQIADDGIDLLVDLGGYTTGARPEISALRPAPVIISWLGFPGTLGHAQLADYLIGDPILTPLEHQPFYTETLALLPDCYQPNDPTLVPEGRPTRGDVGLPEKGTVFCSFNQAGKLTPETLSVWCRLLSDVPESVLWLQLPTDPNSVENLRSEATRRGVSADRLIFAPHLPLPQHLARLALADLALDTFPYGSGATGSNVLRAGVPMITRIGESYVSRMAASQLHAVGLAELVTSTWDDYLDLARSLALDPDRRNALRQKLADNLKTSPLFDIVSFTNNLESLYKRIWSDHFKGIRVPIHGDSEKVK